MNIFYGELPKNQIVEFSPDVFIFAGRIDLRLATVRNKSVLTARDIYEYSQMSRYSPEKKEFTRRCFKSKRTAQQALACLTARCRECNVPGVYAGHLCETCFFSIEE